MWYVFRLLMKRFLLAVALLLPILTHSEPCGRTEVVVLDAAMDEGVALEFCRGSKNEATCKSDALESVRRFEVLLRTQFAAQASCHSVHYVSLANYLADQQLRDKGYWFLTIDLIPYGLLWPGTAWGDPGPDTGQRQRWSIIQRGDLQHGGDVRSSFNGEGSPSEM